jgi:hypothetical protein
MKAIKDALGFSVAPKMQRLISLNGFHAAIMRAEKKTKDNDGLPSGLPIPILPVDYLNEHPKDWVPGEGSYVIPVNPEWGLWFNWTMNDPARTAVLPSVKGMNPITGERSSGYDIKKIEDTCPIHDEPFKTGKYCEKCDFRWPSQNFVSDPNPMYMDGFRQPDGTVRQFYFTEELAKSIPELVIGKEDTVPAFGFCFYKPKKDVSYPDPGKRHKNQFPDCSYSNLYTNCSYSNLYTMGMDYSSREINDKGSIRCRTLGDSIFTLNSYSSDSGLRCRSVGPSERGAYYSSTVNEVKCSETYTSHGIITPPNSSDQIKPDSFFPLIEKEVGVGAGAKIAQDFKNDSRDISYWQEKPSSVVRLYFVFQDEFSYYVSKGIKNLEGNKDGYLSGLPVGGSDE